ncbi:conserved membrane hypothetical protein [Gammaproteobacteria bacterium]
MNGCRVPMRIILLLSALFVAGVISLSTWAWLGRSVDLPDVPSGRLECLSYTPTIGNSSPLDKNLTAPISLLESDIERLKQITQCIRTYSSLRAEGDVVPVAARAGLKILLGIWISTNEQANAKEIERALQLSTAYPEAIRALVVGNEVLLRREMSGKKLASIIREVKARARHPVTYADIFEFWRRNPMVMEAVDIVTLHVLPYWDDPTPVTIDIVQAHVRGIIDTARQTFPGKPLQIGEIGWPSVGRTRGGAAPTLVNAARFVREFAASASTIGLPYNLIEAVDQPWKRLPEGTVGGYWGILDKDRVAKFPLAGPVSEWPDWEFGAAFSFGVAVLALAWAAQKCTALSGARWGLIALTGSVVGSSLWAWFDQVRLTSLGWLGWVWGSYLTVFTVIAALLLIRLAVGDLAVGKSSLPSLAETLSRPRGLGLFRWATLIPAAVVVLLAAIDGRHRDFLTLAYWMPALVLLMLDRANADSQVSNRRDEAWLGVLFILGGVFALDGLTNYEAMVWLVCALMLAFPLLPRTRAEAHRLAVLINCSQSKV